MTKSTKLTWAAVVAAPMLKLWPEHWVWSRPLAVRDILTSAMNWGL